MVRAKAGSDKSHNTTEQDLDDGDEQQSNFYGVDDVLKLLYPALMYNGFKMLPARLGSYASHSIYVLKPLESNPDFQSWKLVKTKRDKERFEDTFKGVIHNIMDSYPDLRDTAIKVLLAGTETPANTNTALYNKGASNAEYETAPFSRSFIGSRKPSAHKVIPSASWFSEELQQLNPLELLSLFPKPEAKALMLLLGRTIIGVGGTEIDGSIVEHRMRMAAIVVGLKAGLGKSCLLGYIKNALVDLGYTTASIGKAGGRFGLARIAQADLGFKDDLTETEQRTMLANIDMKSIITGGEFSGEDKGVNAVDVDPKASIIACTNQYNEHDFYSMDSGSIDRFHFLYTYNQPELTRVYPDFDGKTEPNFKRLSAKYKVSVNQLTTYLLARSAEYFLDTIGMVYENERLYKPDDSESKLQKTIEDLQSHYRYKPYVSHHKKLVTSIAHLVALSMSLHAFSSSKSIVEASFKKIEDSDFSLSLLLNALNFYVNSDTHEAYDLTELNPAIKPFIRQRSGFTEIMHTKNIKGMFETVTSELSTKAGDSFPKTITKYNEVWQDEKMLVREYTELYMSIEWKEMEQDKELFKATVRPVKDI